MSIKTNELQKLSSVLGTDSFIMDTDAVGTARLPLTTLAKFLAEQDNAVKTALSSKAAISTQQTVEKTAVSSRTVEVAAAELYAYISNLPKLLTENLTITVRAGTVAEPVMLAGFYGSGTLTVQAASGADVIFSAELMARNCHVHVIFRDLKIQSTSAEQTIFGASSATVSAYNCAVDRKNTGYTIGCAATGGSIVHLDGCDFSNCPDAAVITREASVLSAYNCTGSGNNLGFWVSKGGVILLSGSTPNLIGGSSNTKEGGVIVAKNGTLL